MQYKLNFLYFTPAFVATWKAVTSSSCRRFFVHVCLMHFLFVFFQLQKRTLIALTWKMLPKMWATLQHAIDVSQLFLPTCFNGFFTWLTPWAMRTSRMLDIKEHQCKCSTCKWNLKLNLIRSLPSQTFIQLMEILLQAGTHSRRIGHDRAGRGRADVCVVN